MAMTLLFSSPTSLRVLHTITTRLHHQNTIMDRALHLRQYLVQLVGPLMPKHIPQEMAENFVLELTAALLSTNQPSNLPDLLKDLQKIMVDLGQEWKWREFETVAHRLIDEPLLDAKFRIISQFPGFIPMTGDDSTSLHGVRDSLRSQSFHDILRSSNRDFRSSPIKQSAVSLSKIIEPYYNTLDEHAVIENLAFTLLGQDSTMFQFSSTNEVIIPPEINISHTMLLTDILEPALIYRRLLREKDSAITDSSPITRAFLRCVDTLLIEYSKTVEAIFHREPSTLQTVFVELESSTRSLRLINYLFTQMSLLLSYDLLVKIHHVSNFGDLHVQNVAMRLFNEASIPYYEYVEHWVIRGELADESKEFFVSFDTFQNHIKDIVVFHPNKVPSFLKCDSALSAKLFQIGKMIIFLEKYLKELVWINNYFTRYSNFIFKVHRGIRNMPSKVFHALISSQYEELVNFSQLVLFSKHNIFLHFRNLKDVMLIGRSDLTAAIEIQGRQLLSGPALQLTAANLSELLTEGILTSSMRWLPENYKNSIQARILDMSHGTIGWEVFTLDYKLMDIPLELALDYKDASTQYFRLFNFLWSLRHFHFLLTESFASSKDLSRRLGRAANYILHPDEHFSWVKRNLRSVDLVRSKLNSFLISLIEYLSWDIVEESFEKRVVRKLFRTQAPTQNPDLADENILLSFNPEFFQHCKNTDLLRGLNTVKSVPHNMNDVTLDDLTDIHSDFLDKVANSKLLREYESSAMAEPYIDQIFGLLNVIQAFVRSHGEFITLVSDYINALSLHESTGDVVEYENVIHHLQRVGDIIIRGYHRDFKPKVDRLRKDLKADLNLRKLGKCI